MQNVCPHQARESTKRAKPVRSNAGTSCSSRRTTSFPRTAKSIPVSPQVRAALALFNDHITRAAFARGVALVDLRLVCTDADYANPIEPSVVGGAKIARAIAALLEPAGETRSVVSLG